MLSAGYVDPAPFDYVIGSAHHIPLSECPPGVDHMPEVTARLIREDFAGDADAAAEAYFREVTRVADLACAKIAGHFDLLTKFDEKHAFFNPQSPRFRKAARAAMDALCDAGKIFEVNTGAISRGWRSEPYPSRELLLELRRRGARVTVSSDAHARDAAACWFPQAETLLRACGFTEIWTFDGREFAPEALG